MFHRLSLKAILIGGAILAAAVPAALVGTALVGSLHDSVIRAATERYELLAKGLASEYDQFLRSHRQAVRTLADHVEEYRAFGNRSVAPLVSRTRARYPALGAIAIVDASGRIVVSDPPMTAEDNVVNQRLAVRLVERQGHVAVLVDTGREAVEALERERFDLVLMDVQMPDMDGLAATAAVREREIRASRSDWVPPAGSSFAADRRIPIVALTAHAMKGDEERCLAAGMDGFVTKPIRPAELASAVERLLPREILPFAKPGPAPVDLEAARRLAAGDEELRAEVAAMFVESSQRHRVELRDAVQATDCAAIEAIAHALKGSAAAVGATAVQAVAAQLEAFSRDGHADRLAALAGEPDRELRRAADFLAAQPSPKAT